ncbi:MAG: trypsin-like peptidase domain-containing protein [Phycisphaerales bacterium]
MNEFRRYAPSLLALICAVATLLLGPEIVRRLSFAGTVAQVQSARSELAASDALSQLNDSVRAVARAVEPSVVHITVQRATDTISALSEISTGSGWIYDDDGRIVTNEHVVRDAGAIEVRLHDGTHRAAELIGADPRTDIAVIQTRNPPPLVPAVRATGQILEQGDLVFAFGSPFGFEFSMSSGIVAGQGRQTQAMQVYENFIQTDADIHPGNSGGPLTNVYGEVVGMNTAITVHAADRGSGGRTGSVGLAIPLDIVEFIVDQLIRTGRVRNGGLGVTLRNLDDSPRGAIGYYGPGVWVRTVTPDEVAHDAGLRRNDVVIAVNDERVDGLSEFARAVGESTDEAVRLRVRRDGRSYEFTLPATNGRANHGYEVGELDRSFREMIEFDGSGVWVESVLPGLPAEDAGIQAADVITAVNGVRIERTSQLRSVVHTQAPGSTVRIQVWRDGAEREFDVELIEWDHVWDLGGFMPDERR